jgi:hypothetical protein
MVPEDASLRVLHDQLGLVPAIHGYFTALGILLVVAKIPAIKNGDEEDCERAAATDAGEQLNLLMASHKDQQNISFADLWQSLKTVASNSITSNLTEPSDVNLILPPLHHYAATTIKISYFRDTVSPGTRASRLRNLRIGLAGNLNCKDDIYQDGTNKIHRLKTLAPEARSSAGPGFENAKVVLFIYRLIDDGLRSMNLHQDAWPDLYSQVKTLALTQNLITIRVPHGVPPQLKERDDLDIFDVTNATEMRLKDKRYAAFFWSQVRAMGEIFGVVGSRTGGLGIAALFGLACFERDEPLLEELASSEQGREGRHWKKHLER